MTAQRPTCPITPVKDPSGYIEKKKKNPPIEYIKMGDVKSEKIAGAGLQKKIIDPHPTNAIAIKPGVTKV
jgi:hypothetical protein